MGTAVSREDVFREVEQMFGEVPHWIREMPDSALGGFWGVMRDFHLAETKLPNKYKELIGLAVSAATRCRYCTLFHTEAARLFGATDEEIREAAMMSAMTMCASTFLNGAQIDFDEFRNETLEALAYVEQKLAASAPKATAESPTPRPEPTAHA